MKTVEFKLDEFSSRPAIYICSNCGLLDMSGRYVSAEVAERLLAALETISNFDAEADRVICACWRVAEKAIKQAEEDA